MVGLPLQPHHRDDARRPAREEAGRYASSIAALRLPKAAATASEGSDLSERFAVRGVEGVNPRSSPREARRIGGQSVAQRKQCVVEYR